VHRSAFPDFVVRAGDELFSNPSTLAVPDFEAKADRGYPATVALFEDRAFICPRFDI